MRRRPRRERDDALPELVAHQRVLDCSPRVIMSQANGRPLTEGVLRHAATRYGTRSPKNSAS